MSMQHTWRLALARDVSIPCPANHPGSFAFLFTTDRSENMIKNEYMKLSRDAGHRRRHATLLGHGHESGDDSGADGGYDKVHGVFFSA